MPTVRDDDPNSEPKVDMDAEFPTDWHRDQYIRDNERGLEGALLRGAKDEEEGFRKELKRLGVGSKTPASRAKKRPAASAKKETR